MQSAQLVSRQSAWLAGMQSVQYHGAAQDLVSQAYVQITVWCMRKHTELCVLVITYLMQIACSHYITPVFLHFSWV